MGRGWGEGEDESRGRVRIEGEGEMQGEDESQGEDEHESEGVDMMVGQNTVPLLVWAPCPLPHIQGRYIARLPTYCMCGGDEGESDGDGDG